MKNFPIRAGVLLASLTLSAATMMAQQTKMKMAPVRQTSATSGKEMFNSYCAACHGRDAKGDGPAAAALKVPPPDLTTLSQRHGGQFPADYVQGVIKFGAENYPAHGTKDMPIWGPVLGSLSGGENSPIVALRIRNLTQYIESLQVR
jgi:mono/diheme cytochrome c family protein